MLDSFDKQLLFGIKFGLNAVTLFLECFFRSKKNKTKKRYKYEVCRLQRQREHIIRERLGIALSQSRHTFGKRYVTSPCLPKAGGPMHLLLMDVLVMLTSLLHFQLSSVTF